MGHFYVATHLTLGTLRFATTEGWRRVARYLGDSIEYGALWRVVARKLKLSCYTTNYVLREIAAVEFNLKMSFQKVRDELIYCFAGGILDEEEFVLLYDAYKSTNSIYPFCTVAHKGNTIIYIPVQKYLLQYNNIYSSTKLIIPVQQYLFQYKINHPSTKIFSPVQN